MKQVYNFDVEGQVFKTKILNLVNFTRHLMKISGKSIQPSLGNCEDKKGMGETSLNRPALEPKKKKMAGLEGWSLN
jgi:hypothetical protein